MKYPGPTPLLTAEQREIPVQQPLRHEIDEQERLPVFFQLEPEQEQHHKLDQNRRHKRRGELQQIPHGLQGFAVFAVQSTVTEDCSVLRVSTSDKNVSPEAVTIRMRYVSGTP